MTDFAARFLVRPDLFPGRIGGEPWGDEEVSLELPPGSFRLVGLNRQQQESVEQRFPSRLRTPTPEDFIVSVFPMENDEFTDFDTAGWTYEMDFDHQATRVRMAGVGFAGIVELNEPIEKMGTPGFGVERAALWSSESDAFSAAVLENFLRVVVAYRLLAAGGVMLHSAAVALEGQARVFVGHSGAGKSTVASLSYERGYEVLSDDINAVVRDERGRLIVDQVPFAGDFGTEQLASGRYALAGIYRLEQAQRHSLEPLSRAATLALLVANAPFVNGDRHRTDALVDVLSSLVCDVDAHKLLFRRDADFWELFSSG